MRGRQGCTAPTEVSGEALQGTPGHVESRVVSVPAVCRALMEALPGPSPREKCPRGYAPCPDDRLGPKQLVRFEFTIGGHWNYYRCPTCGNLLGRYKTQHNVTKRELHELQNRR